MAGPDAVAAPARRRAGHAATGGHTVTRTRLPLRIGVALALVAGIAWALTHRQLFDADTVGSAVNQLGVWAPAGFVVIYAAATVLFFSGAVLSLVGGVLFGPVWGTVWNLEG